MNPRRCVASTLRWIGGGVGIGVLSYAAYAGVTWLRYGHTDSIAPEERDVLLDRFMPTYEVAERHHVRVDAPAALVLAAAKEQDLFNATPIRALIRTRALVLGAPPDNRVRPHGLLAEVQSLGWRVLAEEPGREVVVGAVTKPWEANVVFRALPPTEFAAFKEPGYVKIAWTLRADPIDATHAIFRTETRVATTDATARTRFRRYWSFASPGIVLIRWLSLPGVKRDAQRRAQTMVALH